MKAMLSALFLAMGSEASVAQSDIWRATGDAATAVTGDIRIEHDRIVFRTEVVSPSSRSKSGSGCSKWIHRRTRH